MATCAHHDVAWRCFFNAVIAIASCLCLYVVSQLAIASDVLTSFIGLNDLVPIIPLMSVPYNMLAPALMLSVLCLLFHSSNAHSVCDVMLTSLIIAISLSCVLCIIVPMTVNRDHAIAACKHVMALSCRIMMMTFAIDPPSCTFPSMHVVSIGIITLHAYVRNLISGTFIIALIVAFIMISFSTLAIRQHHIIDIVCAMVIVVIATVASNRLHHALL